MPNIRYANMCHWKSIPYRQIDNFREFYYEDKTNTAYYSDWDTILKYQSALGFDGIEIAPWDLADILPLFGSPENFTAFAKERGVEVIGMFHGAHASHDAGHFDEVVRAGREAVDTIVKFGGTYMNTCPTQNYCGTGPLSRDEVQQCANVMNEIGRYATDHGVKIGLHNEFFCAINIENHRELIESTDPKLVHYCIDTAQISIMGEDLLTFYNDYHDRISTFHLKDTGSARQPDSVRYARDPEIADDGTRWFWEPGLGELDLKGLYRLLKQHAFKGWMSIEYDGSPDLLASMALTRYHLDKELRPIYD
ncbi:sugar phosphate isomerase/epimerase [Sphingomonas sp.]|jgi:inosose dehydratase|uniref:sugar phosphate isomerase/epimerase family protein n=1 Tax=Sphingomonas sp. TaxID=28214 RepID=UPI002E1138E1|nr:sugar phosphate isomerase/epimerase [Sphingomonas sp.]